jgi:hypothetical protein
MQVSYKLRCYQEESIRLNYANYQLTGKKNKKEAAEEEERGKSFTPNHLLNSDSTMLDYMLIHNKLHFS